MKLNSSVIGPSCLIKKLSFRAIHFALKLLIQIITASGLAVAGSTIGEAGDECRPNLIGEDMCAHAREMQQKMSQNLPQQLNSNMTLTKILAVGPELVLYVQFSYDRLYLENLAAGKITMEALADKLNVSTQTILCEQRTTAAFFHLGGKVRYSYSFSDNSPYMDVEVGHCDRTSSQ